MIKTVKIFTFLLIAGFVSSCAKDELEAPSQTPEENAIEAINLDQTVGDMEVSGIDYPVNSTPSSINDDGDDEDEDRTLISVQ